MKHKEKIWNRYNLYKATELHNKIRCNKFNSKDSNYGYFLHKT